ncbi:hypothetical protein RRSWK_03170 [Rhodopirellula sp. SWK7]|nr:hypothetical protein RRSWK_03170 [Rhodopirellula sp. SWK7]
MRGTGVPTRVSGNSWELARGGGAAADCGGSLIAVAGTQRSGASQSSLQRALVTAA